MPDPRDTCQGKLHTGGTNFLGRDAWCRKHIWGGAEPPKPLEAEAGETGHAVTDCVFSTGVWSYFVPICPHCAPTSPFWNGNIYSVHWKKEFVCFLFFILQGLLVGDVPESQKKIWTFKHWNDR